MERVAFDGLLVGGLVPWLLRWLEETCKVLFSVDSRVRKQVFIGLELPCELILDGRN